MGIRGRGVLSDSSSDPNFGVATQEVGGVLLGYDHFSKGKSGRMGLDSRRSNFQRALRKWTDGMVLGFETQIRTNQRRLAWPLGKGDAHIGKRKNLLAARALFVWGAELGVSGPGGQNLGPQPRDRAGKSRWACLPVVNSTLPSPDISRERCLQHSDARVLTSIQARKPAVQRTDVS
jgi:hypothetical protein